MNHPLLAIQHVTLSWNKGERGVRGENARRQFPLAYPLAPLISAKDVMIDRKSFFQEDDRFLSVEQKLGHSLREPVFFYDSVEELNLTNLSLCHTNDQVTITFFYDERRSGKPIRRGHNQDFHNLDSSFYRKDVLNETAFILYKHQYGRVIFNERMTDWDTGAWYYHLQIYNLVFLAGEMLTKDLFIQRKPDYEYRQLAVLH